MKGGDELEYINSVYDTDSHFTIDPTTRELELHAEREVRLIQYDHNSERFSFKMPRYVDGFDMSTCNKVEVHYINIDASTKDKHNDVYPVVDLQVDPDDNEYVIFSWLLSCNCTGYVGPLHFLIRFSCVKDEVVKYVWNTSVYKAMVVSEGIFNTETVLENYVDVLESWKNEVEADASEAVDAALAEIFPKVSNADNGKFLRVVDGKIALVALTDVSEVGA